MALKHNHPPKVEPLPTVTFYLMRQTWERVAAACKRDNRPKLAASIIEKVSGVRLTELVALHVPVDKCQDIATACINHNVGVVGVGVGFATAASSHFEKPKPKQLSKAESKAADKEMTETVARAQAELDLMEMEAAEK